MKKLHESCLTVHQLHEPRTADKNDEKNNGDSWAANRGLFLATLSLPALFFAIGMVQGVCPCVSFSSRGRGCSNRARVCECVCVEPNSCASVHMDVDLSHVP